MAKKTELIIGSYTVPGGLGRAAVARGHAGRARNVPPDGTGRAILLRRHQPPRHRTGGGGRSGPRGAPRGIPIRIGSAM